MEKYISKWVTEVFSFFSQMRVSKFDSICWNWTNLELRNNEKKEKEVFSLPAVSFFKRIFTFEWNQTRTLWKNIFKMGGASEVFSFFFSNKGLKFWFHLLQMGRFSIANGSLSSCLFRQWFVSCGYDSCEKKFDGSLHFDLVSNDLHRSSIRVDPSRSWTETKSKS